MRVAADLHRQYNGFFFGAHTGPIIMVFVQRDLSDIEEVIRRLFAEEVAVGGSQRFRIPNHDIAVIRGEQVIQRPFGFRQVIGETGRCIDADITHLVWAIGHHFFGRLHPCRLARVAVAVILPETVGAGVNVDGIAILYLGNP